MCAVSILRGGTHCLPNQGREPLCSKIYMPKTYTLIKYIDLSYDVSDFKLILVTFALSLNVYQYLHEVLITIYKSNWIQWYWRISTSKIYWFCLEIKNQVAPLFHAFLHSTWLSSQTVRNDVHRSQTIRILVLIHQRCLLQWLSIDLFLPT